MITDSLKQKVESLSDLPVDEMVRKLQDISEEYVLDPDDYETEEGLLYEQLGEIYDRLSGKVLKEENVSRYSSEILSFVADFSMCCEDSDYISAIVHSDIYKDADSLVMLEGISDGRYMPNCDPYFMIDPFDSNRLSLERGVKRGLFSQEDIVEALESVDTSSEVFKELNEVHTGFWLKDHTPLEEFYPGTDEAGKYHAFLGKSSEQDGAFVYLKRNSPVFFACLEQAADYLFEAARKEVDVLLTKSPSDDYRTFDKDELAGLYDIYWSINGVDKLKDPFIGQP